jgi:hypothetical protein
MSTEDTQPHPGPKFVGAFTLNPDQAWEEYRDALFKHHAENMPDHIDSALHLSFMVGLAHGAMLQGQLAHSCVEFVNDRIKEMLDPTKQ